MPTKAEYARQKARLGPEGMRAIYKYNGSWKKSNKTAVNKSARESLVQRLTRIKANAAKKGREYAWNLTDEEAYAMMCGSCVYCGITPAASTIARGQKVRCKATEYNSDPLETHPSPFADTPVTLNGIDRLDNNSPAGYCPENTVSCCERCNMTKGCLDALTHLRRCTHNSLLAQGLHTSIDPEIWYDAKRSTDYASSVKSAAVRNMPFELTEEEFTALKHDSCAFCGRPNTTTHTNGVDCDHNKTGYTLENCQACCWECNSAKKALASAQYLEVCHRTYHNSTKTLVTLRNKQPMVRWTRVASKPRTLSCPAI